MEDLGHWYTTKNIPEEFYGFIYLITNTQTNQKYIGKKQAKTIRKLPPLKGYKRKRKKVVDTDWKTYTGSCQRLNDDIDDLGKEIFRFEIIRFGNSKSELAYVETYYQMINHVLLSDDYYNGIVNIRLGGNCKLDLDTNPIEKLSF